MLEAIEAVCATLGDTTAQVVDGVASLIDKNLLRQTEQNGEEARLVMLETIREYGLEALTIEQEMEITSAAHAAYYLTLAEEAEEKLAGSQQKVWLERLEQEYDNLRAALRWCLEREEMGYNSEMALQLAAALWWFWEVRVYWSEGLNFLERALARSEGIATPLQVKALKAIAHLAYVLNDTDKAEALSGESLMLYREVGHKRGIAWSLLQFANILFISQGDPAKIHTLLEEGLTVCREIGDKEGLAWGLRLKGEVSLQQGDAGTARSLMEESLAIARKMGMRWNIAWLLIELGRVAACQGDYTTAYTFYKETSVIGKEMGNSLQIAYCLEGLADVATLQGESLWAPKRAEASIPTFEGHLTTNTGEPSPHFPAGKEGGY